MMKTAKSAVFEMLVLMTTLLCWPATADESLKIGGHRILIGGFHDHWSRTQQDNPSLLLAAMDYYHYDFICLMDGDERDKWTKKCIEAYSPDRRVFLGKELMFGWGHVVTVGNKITGLSADDPDYRSVLSRLHQGEGLVALAHPKFPVTYEKILLSGELDRLIDDDCMDAVQIGLEPEELSWVGRRNEKGKMIRIVSGWDVHTVKDLKNLPPVLYGPGRSPTGHLDTAGRIRSIVIGAENELLSIKRAVRDERSVLENIETGELIGAKKWVKFLESNGYHEEIRRLDRLRDGLSLAVNSEPVAGRPLTLTFSRAGTVRLPGTLERPAEVRTDNQGIVNIEQMPVLLERDETFMPVVHTGTGGHERVWAVRVNHPIQLDVLPLVRSEGKGAEIKSETPFEGKIELSIGSFSTEAEMRGEKMILPLPAEIVFDRPIDYRLKASQPDGITRHQQSYLTFFSAPYFKGDWTDVPSMRIGAADFTGGYGANRPYPGPDLYSGEIRFAWTAREFLFRASITDPVHCQPFTGHHVYQADALQLAIDPLCRRRNSTGTVYVFNLAMTAGGPEVWRWLSPLEEASGDFTPPDPDVSLGSKYLSMEKRQNGLIYTLKMPWQELSPARPAAGQRIGIYFIMKNNNGDGLIDSLQWPRPVDGVWLVPHRWGVLTLAN